MSLTHKICHAGGLRLTPEADPRGSIEVKTHWRNWRNKEPYSLCVDGRMLLNFCWISAFIFDSTTGRFYSLVGKCSHQITLNDQRKWISRGYLRLLGFYRILRQFFVISCWYHCRNTFYDVISWKHQFDAVDDRSDFDQDSCYFSAN